LTTWACIASGPSLVKEDCDLIEAAGIPTIAVNNSWEVARFASAIMAGDQKWWRRYHKSIDIKAERWYCQKTCGGGRYGLSYFKSSGAYNSGMRAIQLAMLKGATKVILLGYDCSLKNGIHWHGLHKDWVNPSENKVRRWKNQFNKLAEEAASKDVKIINCSRSTALKCFDRMPLEECL